MRYVDDAEAGRPPLAIRNSTMLLGAVAALLTATPPVLAAASADQSSAAGWKVMRGDFADWTLQADHIECRIPEAGAHWVRSPAPVNGDFIVMASLGRAFEKGEGLFFSAAPDLSSGYLLTPGVSASPDAP